jgi:hypothetical protein
MPKTLTALITTQRGCQRDAIINLRWLIASCRCVSTNPRTDGRVGEALIVWDSDPAERPSDQVRLRRLIRKSTPAATAMPNAPAPISGPGAGAGLRKPWAHADPARLMRKKRAVSNFTFAPLQNPTMPHVSPCGFTLQVNARVSTAHWPRHSTADPFPTSGMHRRPALAKQVKLLRPIF